MSIVKVSIITPSFNSSRFIQSTYNCLLKQTMPDWEWLVTDDCSTDGTYDKLTAFAENDARVKVFRNAKNSGAAVSRNNSLKYVSGDYVAFLDSDDLWSPEKLEKQLAFMGEDRCFSFTSYSVIDEEGGSLEKVIDGSHREGQAFNYRDMLLKRATLGCSTVLVESTLIEGLFMPLIRTGQDYAFWLSILKSGVKAEVLPEALTCYRITSGSISRNKFKKAKRQWEIYRSIEKIGLIQSILFFISYSYRAVFR